jgi:nitroreductase
MPEEIGLFEAMYTQRTIRRLKPDPVPDELIARLIEAATMAPTGGNRQNWAFLVIRDQAFRERLGEWYLDAWNRSYGALPDDARARFDRAMQRVYRSAEHLAHHLAEAPVLVLVCAREAPPADAPQFVSASHYGSIFPAVQNLLLAARGLGLGAALTTLHKFHEAEVKALLGIPEGVETVALVPVGYPRGRYGPAKRRPSGEVTHSERWDASKT